MIYFLSSHIINFFKSWMNTPINFFMRLRKSIFLFPVKIPKQALFVRLACLTSNAYPTYLALFYLYPALKRSSTDLKGWGGFK